VANRLGGGVVENKNQRSVGGFYGVCEIYDYNFN
jgi:hypothetical protein